MPSDTLPLPNDARFTTAGGVKISRRREPVMDADPFTALAEALDSRAGVLLRCSVEFPGRYRPQALGFVDPPVRIAACGDRFTLTALNRRGQIILPALADIALNLPFVETLAQSANEVAGRILPSTAAFAEEERTRQPNLFALLRALLAGLASPLDRHLGLYGAFGYDLAFQLESIQLHLHRAEDHRDLVLYLPDCMLIEAPGTGARYRLYYDFTVDGQDTAGLPRETPAIARKPFDPATAPPLGCDHAPGAYQQIVRQAREAFAAGDLFEVVPGQTFREACPAAPSAVYRTLTAINPAPYGALINLGDGEHLVAASPEMYVRVRGDRVETCPISGTIARGGDAVSDADRIRTLLNSAKDEAELTMCTDVDRNDKARVCRPGSIHILGRRQIELYSRLIHTVDHVEGQLRPGFDGLDAFLSHAWAVTVTGAPKRWAMQFIEQHEATARRWYGGAFGGLTIDGGVNTGLTLRTLRLKDGVAEVRAGATLLFDSDPEAEDAECHLKASALRDAVKRAATEAPIPAPTVLRSMIGSDSVALGMGAGQRILFVDHEDSFVHTLASYFRETGAAVTVLRPHLARAALANGPKPSLVVLSPGPGTPTDFGVSETIAAALAAGVPIFGVCLGLQGLVEYFGGALYRLNRPMHGVASPVRIIGGQLFDGLPDGFIAGRYHSLAAVPEKLPECLEVSARTDDGVIMAIEHRSLPISAVQFHPESLMSLAGDAGRRLIGNVVRVALALPKAA